MAKKEDTIADSNTISVAGGVHAGQDVVMRDQYNQLIITMGAFSPLPNLVQLQHEYLAHILRTHHALDFKGIPQLRNLPSELALEEVYVPLHARPELPEGDTWERRLAGRVFERESLPEGVLQNLDRVGPSAPIPIEDALREKNRVVVLGDPGSGKSTMFKYLALRLAQTMNAPLPILLPLNAYARALNQKDVNLQSYLAEYFAGRAQGVAALGPLFADALQKGKAVILLDGLDEVQNQRPALVEKVEAFASEAVAQNNRVLVSSRIVGYRDALLAAKDWSLYTLLDFDPDAIETFARRWCLAFEKSTLGNTPEAKRAAETERIGLMQAIQANPGVGRLASNPLLLTILALIKRQGVELPKSRIKLYDRYLETLIEAWNRASALDRSAGRESLDYESTLEVLGPLALHIREENPTAGLVSAHQLQGWLAEHYTSEQWGMKAAPAREKARAFIESVRQHSNLLLERGEGRYGFIHLTFEEALAAYGLVAAGQVEPQKSLDTIQAHLIDPAWRETILLSVGVRGLINRQPQAAGEMVRAMLKMSCAEEHAAQNLLIAGACLEDVGATGMGQTAALEVIAALEAANRNRTLPPATQRNAGFILGRLAGSNPVFLERIRPDLDIWINIPAGKFLYGNDKHKEIIQTSFAIQKYPVTNLQFQRFIDDKGYQRSEFWSIEGWIWRTGRYTSKVTNKDHKSWLIKRRPEKCNEPYYWYDEKWNNPLAPVIGITWFEAEAYSQWLAKLEGKTVRLPTELEWECAARGSLSSPVRASESGREYAWGDSFDRNKLNAAPFWKQNDKASYAFDVSEASTTIVGQFLEGSTPEAIGDLSGNVWEWTDSWYEKKRINRVVRGGSWDHARSFVHCAFRIGSAPDFHINNIGFRLVAHEC